ncbi:SURF1 family protein [Gordonia sp. VNK21]|uniref:SURF1 family cytochrome oxidase biogenesis protein n=1 Tax=Gordonia sp. VNK21 TaxID=3382483 RepID=UPI0038D431E8
MQVLRTFLRPGWVLATLLVIVFAVACFLVLAPWQLGKNADTEHRNDLIRKAADTPAVALGELAPAGAVFDTGTEWRSVTMTGEYLADHQVVVRLKSFDSRPAAEILTPFRLTGSDRVVLVNRGWVRPEEDGSVDVPVPPAGPVTVEGRLRRTEGTSPGKEPREADGALSAYTIDTALLGPPTGQQYEGFYVQLSAQQPGSLGEIELPQLESGPYLSYGLQWLAFGVMAPLGVLYFIWSEVKHRRKVAAQKAAESGGAPLPDEELANARTIERQRIRDELREAGSDPTEEPRPASPIGDGMVPEAPSAAVKAKLAQRYGR